MPLFGVIKLRTELACLDSWTNQIRLCVCVHLWGMPVRKLVFTHTHLYVCVFQHCPCTSSPVDRQCPPLSIYLSVHVCFQLLARRQVARLFPASCQETSDIIHVLVRVTLLGAIFCAYYCLSRPSMILILHVRISISKSKAIVRTYVRGCLGNCSNLGHY